MALTTSTPQLFRRPKSLTGRDYTMLGAGARPKHRQPLYTPEQRQRRDSTTWTIVQGVLAPVQFLIFLISLALIARYFVTQQGLMAATISVIVKTIALYAIMVTGSIWEKVVFGRYLFAPAFFWEDVFSMVVLVLHTAYIGCLTFGWLSPRGQMLLALSAYATYVINAGQFLYKLRLARLSGDITHAAHDAQTWRLAS